MKHIVIVLNGKGGVGKSFFAVQFVQYLKEKGQRCTTPELIRGREDDDCDTVDPIPRVVAAGSKSVSGPVKTAQKGV